jgi:hypothetical protein
VAVVLFRLLTAVTAIVQWPCKPILISRL